MKLIIVSFFLILSFSSCFQSNAIYFDVNEQSIRSCNSKGIRQLYIENDSTPEEYSITWIDDNKNAPTSVSIFSIDDSYNVARAWDRRRIDNKKFRLLPFNKYTITRMQGDASAYQIEVWTGENANIIKSIPDKCND
jgi:hypothetical protein